MQDPDSARAELEADASLLGEPRRMNVSEVGGWMAYDDDERTEGRKERMAGARVTRRKVSRRVLYLHTRFCRIGSIGMLKLQLRSFFMKSKIDFVRARALCDFAFLLECCAAAAFRSELESCRRPFTS